MSRTYIPLSGDPNTYGRRGEHTFFRTEDQQPPASAPVQSSVFDSAMNTLKRIAGESTSGDQGTPGSSGNLNDTNKGPEGTLSDLGISATPSQVGSVLGTGLGLATGIPGLGLAGTAIGTAIEGRDIDNALSYAGAPELSFGQLASGFANNATFGAFGTNLNDAMVANTNAMVDAARAAGEGGYSADAGYSGPAGGFGGGYGGDVPDSGGTGVTGREAAGGEIYNSNERPRPADKPIAMQDGGFVVPADVVSGLGDGSTKAGYRRLGLGQLLDGPGTGMSDDIPAHIDGEQPARVADGEVYLSPEEVALYGGGSHAKGIKRLYALMSQVRQHRHGTEEQPQPLNLGDL